MNNDLLPTLFMVWTVKVQYDAVGDRFLIKIVRNGGYIRCQELFYDKKDV
jgi:hypothetical protein